jgi:hypothetical protein
VAHGVPPEVPLQDWRPASGFPQAVLIGSVYPFVTKLPPAAKISLNAPAPIFISSTPPSKASVALLTLVSRS